MLSRKLPHYIRMHRKRSGFSQDDVAFLLSASTGAKLSRYEHFKRQPNLEAALALEILFRTPVRTLFGGTADRVEQSVMSRVETLSRNLKKEPPSPETVRKLEMLKAICGELRQMRSQRI